MRNTGWLDQHRKLTLSECESIVRELHHSATLCRMTAGKLQEHLNDKLWRELKSRTESGHRRYTTDFVSFVSGYAARVREVFWEEQVYYAMKFEGVIYSGDPRRPETVKENRDLYRLIESRGQLMQDVDVEGAHLFVGTIVNHTDWTDVNAHRKGVKP